MCKAGFCSIFGSSLKSTLAKSYGTLDRRYSETSLLKVLQKVINSLAAFSSAV